MTPDKRRALLTRINEAVDALPDRWMPAANTGWDSMWLVVPDTTDDDALVGMTEMIEDLAADLGTAIELLDEDGTEKLSDARERRRGRRGWTDPLFARRWREACERSGPPYTYRHVAPSFDWLDGMRRVDADPEYLGKLWRKHGSPGPSPEDE